MKINTESRESLKTAKVEGSLHEALLERRSKMKADRYCKWLFIVSSIPTGEYNWWFLALVIIDASLLIQTLLFS